MMKYLQKLGKSLMLPVACLPVCGILMGIGYILAPAAMAGEVAGFTAGGFAYTLGLFMIKAGGALIDNMAWLFAIGVAIGMSDDNDGTAALAGLVAMLLFQNLLSSGVVSALTGKEAAAAFGKINNQFIGKMCIRDSIEGRQAVSQNRELKPRIFCGNIGGLYCFKRGIYGCVHRQRILWQRKNKRSSK